MRAQGGVVSNAENHPPTPPQKNFFFFAMQWVRLVESLVISLWRNIELHCDRSTNQLPLHRAAAMPTVWSGKIADISMAPTQRNDLGIAPAV